jgi:cell division protein FtsZ
VRQAPQILKTGTDGVGFPVPMGDHSSDAGQMAPGTDYSRYEAPTVWRDPRSQAASRVEALEESGMDRLDIPAFLRKQAD